jgi:MYXO-CTERM domain-containing protein
MFRKHTLAGTLSALAIGAAVAAPVGAQPLDVGVIAAKATAQHAGSQDLRSPDAKGAVQPVVSRDLRSPDAKDQSRANADGLRLQAQERYYASYGQPAPEAPVTQSTSDGFDWDTAGLGAGTVAGLALLALGGVAVTRRRAQEA